MNESTEFTNVSMHVYYIFNSIKRGEGGGSDIITPQPKLTVVNAPQTIPAIKLDNWISTSPKQCIPLLINFTLQTRSILKCYKEKKRLFSKHPVPCTVNIT